MFLFFDLLVTVPTLFLVILLDITFFNCVTIFFAVRAALVLYVLAETIVNHLSIFITTINSIIVFSIHTINNLVEVCTAPVSRSV